MVVYDHKFDRSVILIDNVNNTYTRRWYITKICSSSSRDSNMYTKYRSMYSRSISTESQTLFISENIDKIERTSNLLFGMVNNRMNMEELKWPTYITRCVIDLTNDGAYLKRHGILAKSSLDAPFYNHSIICKWPNYRTLFISNIKTSLGERGVKICQSV